MSMTLVPTTELEAVNLMLSTVGESPVTSLEDTGSVDTSQAQLMLANVMRQVQQRGWWFNEEEDFPLIPNAYTGYILVPANTLKLKFDDTSIVQRGTRLYNKSEHTYVFSAAVTAKELVLLLSFDELPEQARNLIAQRASRMFQERMFGSDTISKAVQHDEAIAYQDLVVADMDARSPNALKDSTHAQKLLARK